METAFVEGIDYEHVGEGVHRHKAHKRPGINAHAGKPLFSMHPDGTTVEIPVDRRKEALRRLRDAWLDDGPHAFLGVWADKDCTIVVDNLDLHA